MMLYSPLLMIKDEPKIKKKPRRVLRGYKNQKIYFNFKLTPKFK